MMISIRSTRTDTHTQSKVVPINVTEESVDTHVTHDFKAGCDHSTLWDPIAFLLLIFHLTKFEFEPKNLKTLTKKSNLVLRCYIPTLGGATYTQRSKACAN